MIVSGVFLMFSANDTNTFLLISRAIGGFTQGLIYVVVVVHVSENATKEFREFLMLIVGAVLNYSILLSVLAFFHTEGLFRTGLLNGLGLTTFGVCTVLITTKHSTETVPFILQNNGSELDALQTVSKLKKKPVAARSVHHDFLIMKNLVQDEIEQYGTPNFRKVLLPENRRSLIFCCYGRLCSVLSFNLPICVMIMLFLRGWADGTFTEHGLTVPRHCAHDKPIELEESAKVIETTGEIDIKAPHFITKREANEIESNIEMPKTLEEREKREKHESHEESKKSKESKEPKESKESEESEESKENEKEKPSGKEPDESHEYHHKNGHHKENAQEKKHKNRENESKEEREEEEKEKEEKEKEDEEKEKEEKSKHHHHHSEKEHKQTPKHEKESKSEEMDSSEEKESEKKEHQKLLKDKEKDHRANHKNSNKDEKMKTNKNERPEEMSKEHEEHKEHKEHKEHEEHEKQNDRKHEDVDKNKADENPNHIIEKASPPFFASLILLLHSRELTLVLLAWFIFGSITAAVLYTFNLKRFIYYTAYVLGCCLTIAGIAHSFHFLSGILHFCLIVYFNYVTIPIDVFGHCMLAEAFPVTLKAFSVASVAIIEHLVHIIIITLYLSEWFHNSIILSMCIVAFVSYEIARNLPQKANLPLSEAREQYQNINLMLFNEPKTGYNQQQEFI